MPPALQCNFMDSSEKFRFSNFADEIKTSNASFSPQLDRCDFINATLTATQQLHSGLGLKVLENWRALDLSVQTAVN